MRVLPLLPMIVRESMFNSRKSYDNVAYALKLNASDFKEEGVVFEGCKYVVKRMSELGIDLIEISGGNYEAPVFDGKYERGVGFVTYAVVLALFLLLLCQQVFFVEVPKWKRLLKRVYR